MRVFLVLVIFVAAICNGAASAQPQNNVQLLSEELTRLFHGGDGEFVSVGEGSGWRGVAIVPPGTSISQISSAYDGLPDTIVQKFVNDSIFDRPVVSENNYAKLGVRSLETVWEEILEKTRPLEPLPRDRRASWAVYRWIFQPILRNGKVVGYSREPSRYVRRYREFEEQFNILVNGKETGLWKLHPRLKKYEDYEDAVAGVLNDWNKSGFKAEVEAATWSFENTASGDAWRNWSFARVHFEAHRVPIEEGIKLPETYIIPPPSAWPTMGSWIKARSAILGDNRQISYQVARIRLLRPWMDIESLVSGNLRVILNEGEPEYMVSSGIIPSQSELPSGMLPAYAEEIILVRDIVLPEGMTEVSEHPLGIFASPSAINLIGFTVRTLPEIPTVRLDSLNEDEPGTNVAKN